MSKLLTQQNRSMSRICGIITLFFIINIVTALNIGLDDVINDCCSGSITSFMCSGCYGPCPLRENGVNDLESVLSSRVFGQDHAIRLIVEAMSYRENDKPLVFHFAGDNGVGKTLTAKTIVESLFAVKDRITGEYKGMLYLRGNFYCSDGEDNARNILEEIFKQLTICPESVIIFDEAELPDKNTMQIFETILDESPTIRYSGKEVLKSKAIFILISDFGMEGVTNNMSVEDIMSLIHKDAGESWIHTKQNDMITYIVPFLPMEIRNSLWSTPPLPVTKQAGYLLQRITYNPPSILKKYGINVKTIEIGTKQLDKLSEYVYNTAINNPQYRNKNYRGIEQFFNKNIVPQIAKHAIKLSGLHGKKELDIIIQSVNDGILSM